MLSLGSLVGLLTVLDNAVRNCIMLFTHYQHLEQEEGEPFGLELVLRGSLERVTPMVMLGLTAGLALVPLLIAGNIPGNEIEYPMAIVILGGLLTSEVLNLFVVPHAVPALWQVARASARPSRQPPAPNDRSTLRGGRQRVWDGGTVVPRRLRVGKTRIPPLGCPCLSLSVSCRRRP